MRQSEKLQRSLDEINGKVLAKAGTKAWNAAKKVGHYTKDSLLKSADTARNAIVAGVAAPVGAKISQDISNRNQNKRYKSGKKRYTTSDVAAIGTAMRRTDEEFSIHENALLDRVKANIADFAKTESEAYLKAKAIIDRAEKEKIDTEKGIALSHPILTAIKDGVRIFGHIFIAILLGLLFITLYSRHTGSAKALLKGVMANVSPNIINDALILIGISAGVNKLKQITNKSESFKTNEDLNDWRQTLKYMLDCSLAEEQDAISAYEKRAQQCSDNNDEQYASMFKELADDETVHAAQLKTILAKYGFEDQKLNKQGEEEATEIMNKGDKLKESVRVDVFIPHKHKRVSNTYKYAKDAIDTVDRDLDDSAEKGTRYELTVESYSHRLREAAEHLGTLCETSKKNRTKPYAQGLKKMMTDNTVKKTLPKTKKITKTVPAKDIAKKVTKTLPKAEKAKEIFKGSAVMKKALDRAAFKGGLKGAALATGAGAAAYGINKLRKIKQDNRYEY